MAPLSNPRWERFAQALAKGMTQTDAYVEAGYKANEGNASTLKGNQKVQARLAELLNRAAAKTEITVAKLTDMYLDDRKLARENVQSSAAVSAVTAIAKLHGLMIDQSKAEVVHRYVLRAPTPSKTMDEWIANNRPATKPNGSAKTVQ